MMKAKWIAGILLMAITISACDDDTATVGSSLTKDVDHFTIYTDTFNVATRSIKIDSVLSKSEYCYLGRIKDPTTGDYVTSDFTTQFNTLESLAGKLFFLRVKVGIVELSFFCRNGHLKHLELHGSQCVALDAVDVDVDVAGVGNDLTVVRLADHKAF